jgi:hypothetical protein
VITVAAGAEVLISLRRRLRVWRSLPVLRAYGAAQEQVGELTAVVSGCALARPGGAAGQQAQVAVLALAGSSIARLQAFASRMPVAATLAPGTRGR